MEDYSFGECPICRQGILLAVRNRSNGKLLIMCDDCESQWLTPHDAQSFDNALPNEIHDIQMATIEEIKAVGWLL